MNITGLSEGEVPVEVTRGNKGLKKGNFMEKVASYTQAQERPGFTRQERMVQTRQLSKWRFGGLG